MLGVLGPFDTEMSAALAAEGTAELEAQTVRSFYRNPGKTKNASFPRPHADPEGLIDGMAMVAKNE
jgi:hypothetical protein